MLPLLEDDDHCVRFFGPRKWGSEEIAQTPTPIGEPCLSCKIPIFASDFGVTMIFHPSANHDGTEEIGRCAYHRSCFLDNIGITNRS